MVGVEDNNTKYINIVVKVYLPIKLFIYQYFKIHCAKLNHASVSNIVFKMLQTNYIHFIQTKLWFMYNVMFSFKESMITPYRRRLLTIIIKALKRR